MTEYIDKTEVMRRFKPFGREIPKEQVMAVLARIEALNREPSEDGTLEVKVEDATKIGRVLISDDEHRGGLCYPDEDEPKGEDLISRAEAYTRIAELSRDLLNDDCINLGNASEYLRIIRELPSADRPTDGDLISRQAATSIPILPKEHRKVFRGEDDAFETGWNEALACVNMLPSADRPTDGDLISRADAIEAMGEEPLVWCDEEYEIAERSQWRDDIEAIKSVPSADRPRGEWIHTPNGIDRDFVWWTCSECGHKIFSETEKDRIEFHAYCGRCGADMRGEDE